MANNTRKSERTATDMDLGSRVSERVQIQNVHLLETRVKRGSLRDKPPPHLHINVNVTTQIDETKLLVLVRPFLTVVARYDDATDSEETLRIDAVFNLTYKLSSSDGLDKDNYVAFGKTNGLYNAWPFMREYVQAMTLRLGLPPLTIPVLPPNIPYTPVSASKRTKSKKTRKPSSETKRNK